MATNRTTDQVLFSPENIAANRSHFGMRHITDVWRNQHVIIPRAETLYVCTWPTPQLQTNVNKVVSVSAGPYGLCARYDNILFTTVVLQEKLA